MKEKIILASSSQTRKKLLENTGLAFQVISPEIDEDKAIAEARSNGTHSHEIPVQLARLKGLQVSRQNPDSLVISADQVLICQDEILQKARSKEEAIQKLKKLRGQRHQLVSGVCLTRNLNVLWTKTETATLHMEEVSDAYLENYIDSAGDTLFSSVGAYAVEGYGAWLFSKIEGDYFTILGLPLIPLLQYLRSQFDCKPGRFDSDV